MIKDLVKQTRSYRSFDESRRISREELVELVDTARLTASTRNMQPLKYRLVYTPEECAAVLSFTGWAAGLKGIKMPPEGHAPVAYIVICCDTTMVQDHVPFLRDTGIVAQTIMLSATEMGLGGCMIGSFSASHIAQTLSIPEGVRPLLVLGLGKPDETVILVESEDGNTAYWRDENAHYTPKRKLEDVIL